MLGSSGSEYPYGPYIGFPSYAHPIIGECCALLSINTSLKVSKYPQIEYCNLLLDSFNNSSPNLALLLTLKDLTLESRIALDPDGTTLIIVDPLE